MCADGALFSVMVGAGETYLPAFALAIGMGEVTAGLLAGLPVLAGAVVQLVTPFAVRRMGSHRRWVVACATVQALTFLPLVAAALLGAIPLPVMFVFVVLYWASGMSTGPAWNTWAETLVPKRIATRFFANRARLGQIALLLALVGAGLMLESSREAGRPLVGFAVVFLVAGVARGLSASALARQSEPVRLPADYRIVSPRVFADRSSGPKYRRLLVFMLGLQAAVHVAAPYFNPYMLGQLAFSYDQYVALLAASLMAKAIFAPIAADLIERFGTARVLGGSALALAPLPALWMVADGFGYLLALQVVSGFAWAVYELITLLLFFEAIAPAERTSVLTLFNLANAAAICVGTAAGGWMLSTMGSTRSAYYVLFAVSAAARLAVALWARTLRPPRVKAHTVVTRTLAVRPAVGTIERPVLPAITDRTRFDAIDA